jgi:hypothetical protein
MLWTHRRRRSAKRDRRATGETGSGYRSWSDRRFPRLTGGGGHPLSSNRRKARLHSQGRRAEPQASQGSRCRPRRETSEPRGDRPPGLRHGSHRYPRHRSHGPRRNRHRPLLQTGAGEIDPVEIRASARRGPGCPVARRLEVPAVGAPCPEFGGGARRLHGQSYSYEKPRVCDISTSRERLVYKRAGQCSRADRGDAIRWRGEYSWRAGSLWIKPCFSRFRGFP